METVIAAVGNDRSHLIAESADLLFHLLVLLKSRGVKLEEVEAALAQRTSMSGLEEKASRKRDQSRDSAWIFGLRSSNTIPIGYSRASNGRVCATIPR